MRPIFTPIQDFVIQYSWKLSRHWNVLSDMQYLDWRSNDRVTAHGIASFKIRKSVGLHVVTVAGFTVIWTICPPPSPSAMDSLHPWGSSEHTYQWALRDTEQTDLHLFSCVARYLILQGMPVYFLGWLAVSLCWHLHTLLQLSVSQLATVLFTVIAWGLTWALRKGWLGSRG